MLRRGKNPGAENSGINKKYECMKKENSKSHITCYHQNVKSLKANSKPFWISFIARRNQFDIIALNETWLKFNLLHGYKIYRKDTKFERRGGGGGDLLRLEDNIAGEPIQCPSGTLELTSAIIKTFDKNILVSIRYRSPDVGAEFVEHLNQFSPTWRTIKYRTWYWLAILIFSLLLG